MGSYPSITATATIKRISHVPQTVPKCSHDHSHTYGPEHSGSCSLSTPDNRTSGDVNKLRIYFSGSALWGVFWLGPGQGSSALQWNEVVSVCAGYTG